MSERARLSIDITEEQNDALYRLIPWGLKKPLFHKIIDGLIPLLEKHGVPLIYIILGGRITISELLQHMEEYNGNTSSTEEGSEGA